MTKYVGENGSPLPRSLSDLRAVKREMAQLYRQTKGGLIEPQLCGRLAHLLGLIAGVIKHYDLEERLDALERRMAEAGAPLPGERRASSRALTRVN